MSCKCSMCRRRRREGRQFQRHKTCAIRQLEAQEEVFRLKQQLEAKNRSPMDTDLSDALRAEVQRGKEKISEALGRLDQETRAKSEVEQKAEADVSAA